VRHFGARLGHDGLATAFHEPERSLTRKILIGVVVGVALLALALWGVPLEDVKQALTELELVYLIPIAALFLGQQAIRATRQMVLVRAVRPESTWWTNVGVLCMGFLCVNTFPVRLGEVVRPMLLQRKEGIPVGTGFGLMFVERLLDLTAVLVMLQVVLAVVELPSASIELAGGTWDVAELGRQMATGMLVPVLIGVVVLLLLGERVLSWVDRVGERLGPGLFGRLWRWGAGFTRSFVGGLEVVRQPKRLAVLIGLTAATWIETTFMYTLLADALGLGEFIGYPQGMGVLVLTMLGTMAPAPPGFVGVYEAAVRGALGLFGVVGESLRSRAVAFALVMHWWTYLVQAVSAWWFFRTETEGWLSLLRRSLGLKATAPPDA
jgi:uncharacterized membrane protein YbhN (UPF0104 family)